MRVAVKVCGLALAVAAVPELAQAELILGLQGSNRILAFDSATPGSILSNRSIVGIGAGETLIGLDVRPANQLAYTLATNGNLYSLFDGGVAYSATLVGNIANTLTGSNFGIDFNAVP